jgi:hypothetical protein
MVKRRVKTGHLGQVRESPMKRLRQEDLLRQMLRICRSESPVSNKANLMFDEPPLMVRILG